jgi:hypothetical protein
MKYAVEMGSGDIICIASFIKTGSDVQKYFYSFKIRKVS